MSDARETTRRGISAPSRVAIDGDPLRGDDRLAGVQRWLENGGWQLARHIRNVAPGLPLVMVSADASDGVVQGVVADSAAPVLHQ